MSLWSWLSGAGTAVKRVFGKPAKAREVSSLLTHGPGLGVLSGAWTDSRIEQSRAYKHWVYVAITRIADKIASQQPNIASLIPRHTDKRKWHFPSPVNANLTGSFFAKALTPLRGHEDLEPVGHDHPFLRLLHDPNEPDTSYDLWFETVLFLLLTGSAYWWLPKNKLGLPVAIWVLPSHWVWPLIGRDKLVDGYELRPTDGNYLRRTLDAEDVVHFRRKSAISKIDGYGPLTAGAQWIDTQGSVDRSRWHTFKNGAFPSAALEFDPEFKDPTAEELDRIEAKFLARYAGEVRTGRPLLLPPGVKFHKISVTPREMDYGDTAEQIRDNILALFGLSAAAVGIVKSMTYGSVVAAQAGFCMNAVNPLCRFIGQVITEKVARRYDESLRVFWDDFTPQDPEFVEKAIQTDLSCGAISPNEVRALRGRRPYPNGGDDPVLPHLGIVLPFNSGGSAQNFKTAEPQEPEQPNPSVAAEKPEDFDDASDDP